MTSEEYKKLSLKEFVQAAAAAGRKAAYTDPVFFAGINGGSWTHMGVFDISPAANISDIIYLAPTCKEEYFSMPEWS